MTDSQVSLWSTVAQLVPVVLAAVVFGSLAFGRRLPSRTARVVWEVLTFLFFAAPLAAVELLALYALESGTQPPPAAAGAVIGYVVALLAVSPFMANYLRLNLWVAGRLQRLAAWATMRVAVGTEATVAGVAQATDGLATGVYKATDGLATGVFRATDGFASGLFKTTNGFASGLFKIADGFAFGVLKAANALLDVIARGVVFLMNLLRRRP